MKKFFYVFISLILFLSGCQSLSSIKPLADPLLTVIAGGDVLPGVLLTPYLEKNGADYPYYYLAPIFKTADISLVNLESPLSLRGKRLQNKVYTFRSKPSAARALKESGVNAVSLANNHMMDYGTDALNDTIKYLKQNDIAFAGAGKNITLSSAPAMITIPQKQKVALLAYSLAYPPSFWATKKRAGTAHASIPAMIEDIKKTKEKSDLVLVYFHWSQELVNFPRAYQTGYGRAAIDAGASAVIGAHPHVLQGIEFYKKGVIIYSLGNLVFGGSYSRLATKSMLVKFTFIASSLNKLEVLPLLVDNRKTKFRSRPADKKLSKIIIQDLKTYSKSWKTDFIYNKKTRWYEATTR